MKKVFSILVIAIAILVLFVGFKYASAQNLLGLPAGSISHPNYAGPLTHLNLHVIYQEEIPATNTHAAGLKLVKVVPRIEHVVNGKLLYDPVLYFYMSPNGVYAIDISWLNPKGTSALGPDGQLSTRIWTISCGGGNLHAPTPGLGKGGISDPKDGLIISLPALSNTKPPPIATASLEGVASCWFCPDGFQFDSSGNPTNVCNGGESYISGFMTQKGEEVVHFAGSTVTSAYVVVTGTVASSGFIYVGEEWAAKDCVTSSTFPECKALFSGSFKATLTQCPSGDPNCFTVE